MTESCEGTKHTTGGAPYVCDGNGYVILDRDGAGSDGLRYCPCLPEKKKREEMKVLNEKFGFDLFKNSSSQAQEKAAKMFRENSCLWLHSENSGTGKSHCAAWLIAELWAGQEYDIVIGEELSDIFRECAKDGRDWNHKHRIFLDDVDKMIGDEITPSQAKNFARIIDKAYRKQVSIIITSQFSPSQFCAEIKKENIRVPTERRILACFGVLEFK